MDPKVISNLLHSRTSINSKTGCWEYLGTNADGYGQIMLDGIFYYTHQLSAMTFLGYRKSSDLIVCHHLFCPSKACWNPEHLYIGTYANNNQDIRTNGNARGRYSGVTHCVNGHEFTPENTFWAKRDKGGKMRRQCRTCKNIGRQKLRQKQAAILSFKTGS